MSQADFRGINNALLGANKIILISHQKPDGDACGSTLAMFAYLKSIGKDPKIYFQDPPPLNLNFLPYFEQISHDSKLIDELWDAVVFLDLGDINYAGVLAPTVKATTIINLDHHFTNLFYGHLNYVDDKASSACEVVYDFFTAIGYEPDIKVATCLLNGILTDTGGFSNAATTAKAMRIASALISRGARVEKISNFILKTKNINALRLWGKILSRFQINKQLGVGYTYVTESDWRDFQVTENDIEGLANFLNVLSEVPVGMFIKIFSDKINVSLRTKSDEIDVSKIAFLFGGGGHKKAAGFSLPWRVEEKDGHLTVI